MRFILLAVAAGDGEPPVRGDRLFAQVFHTRAAAEQAHTYLAAVGIEATVIDDFNDPAPTGIV